MKKFLFGLVFICGIAKADGGPDQILTSLLQHVTPVSEFTTHGQTKLQFIDGVIQAGHYNGDYIFALDGGVSDNLNPGDQGHLAGTVGVHVHAISFLNTFFHINPELGKILQAIEATPRYSYDWDVHHAVLGFTFGAKISF